MPHPLSHIFLYPGAARKFWRAHNWRIINGHIMFHKPMPHFSGIELQIQKSYQKLIGQSRNRYKKCLMTTIYFCCANLSRSWQPLCLLTLSYLPSSISTLCIRTRSLQSCLWLLNWKLAPTGKWHSGLRWIWYVSTNLEVGSFVFVTDRVEVTHVK